MTNTPDILLRAMAAREAAGLYAAVHPADARRFMDANGGVLSIFAKDAAQLRAYVTAVEARGCRVVRSKAAERVEAAIVDECASPRPCPDMLAVLEGLRGKTDAEIDEFLTALGD